MIYIFIDYLIYCLSNFEQQKIDWLNYQGVFISLELQMLSIYRKPKYENIQIISSVYIWKKNNITRKIGLKKSFSKETVHSLYIFLFTSDFCKPLNMKSHHIYIIHIIINVLADWPSG